MCNVGDCVYCINTDNIIHDVNNRLYKGRRYKIIKIETNIDGNNEFNILYFNEITYGLNSYRFKTVQEVIKEKIERIKRNIQRG